MEKIKNLEIICEEREFVNKDTAQVQKYTAYFVVVSGIEVPVMGKDKTARAIIKQYYHAK